MPRHTVTLEVEVVINTSDEAEARIDSYVGLDAEAAAKVGYNPGLTKDQLMLGLAINCVYGRTNANQDGYADLDSEAISARIDDVREY